jgi:hypothetical protein
MSTLTPTAPARHDPPWWVVLLALPLVGTTLVVAALGVLSGVSLIDAVSASRSVSRSVEMPAGGTVEVSATSAAVTIEAGPDGQVSVVDSMTVRSPTQALARQALDTFRQSGLSTTSSGVSVAIPTPEDFNLTAFQLQRRVTVRVPADAPLRLRGDSVAADIHDLRGDLDLSVGPGALRLKGVTVTGSDRVTSTAGAIDFEGTLQAGSLDIETHSGAINVALPAGTNASYDVATASGAIFVRPETGRSSASAGRDRSLTGAFGAGTGATLRVRATSGAISVTVR